MNLWKVTCKGSVTDDAQNVGLQGYGPSRVFLTSKISYLLFPNLTHKTKARSARIW
jgi:hypothetical protein